MLMSTSKEVDPALQQPPMWINVIVIMMERFMLKLSTSVPLSR